MPLNEPAFACISTKLIANIAIKQTFKPWTCNNIDFQKLDVHKPGAEAS